MSKQIALLLALAAALAVGVPAALAAPADTMKPQLVRTIMDKQLGAVLTTAGKQAIYVWNKERAGTLKCTGACAKAWPPVLVKTGVVVPMHVNGVMGEFGTIRRAGGARQLTFNRRALYTFAKEKPGVVGCNNVDSWFAVKVHA
jgi:predicted lipoprotein with Yx(FWY)xxD motif